MRAFQAVPLLAALALAPALRAQEARASAPAFPSSAGQLPARVGGAFSSPARFPRSLPPFTVDPALLSPAAVVPVDSFSVSDLALDEALYRIAARAEIAIAVEGLAGRTTSFAMPAGSGIDALARVAAQEGLRVWQDGAVLHVAPAEPATDAEPVNVEPVGEGPPGEGPGAEWAGAEPAPLPHPLPLEASSIGLSGVRVEAAPDGTALVSISVEDALVSDVLRELSRSAGLSVVASPHASEARVTAHLHGLSLDEALRVLLTGTPLTSHREGATVVVADRMLPGMLTSRLVRLRHVPAGGILERIPDALRREATFQLIQEQNALVVTAPADVVAAAEAFVAEIDQPADQILLEVLVVEFETSGLKQVGVSFLGGLLPGDPNAPALAAPDRPAYVFGGGDDQRGGLDLVGGAGAGQKALNFWSDVLGIRSIGRLPADFYFRLQALERAGRAEVRSRPHIATLNGNTASITVGTSQYYILKSSYGYGAQGAFGSGGDAERFEYVRADVQLEITPWVTEDGAVTAVIRPAFATPVGAFDPRIPPTINSWSVDTSVRLSDGETFMIGGLVQEHESTTENRVPVLGRLPLVGRLFRNSQKQKRTSELVIFITPHILGDGTEASLESLPHLGPHTSRGSD